MHELFTKVLSKRDLSRAGELFSIADSELVNDITEVLSGIDEIIGQSDYVNSKNDQSVVEICVTRVLSCIRETQTAERYCSGLINLLKTCLKYDLKPIISFAQKRFDPPHAKISADIISSIFLNYNKKSVMAAALPIAVKFLPKGNDELSKNLASNLSLAAIEYAYLLCPHTETILDSIMGGNYGLCRVLQQLYEAAPEELNERHANTLVSLLPICDRQERLALLQLFKSIGQNKPIVLEKSIPKLCDLLNDTANVQATLQVLLKMAEHRPYLIIEHFDNIKSAALEVPVCIPLAAQIFSQAGRVKKEEAQYALDFVLQHLQQADRTSQHTLLQEAAILCSTYPVLFTDKVLACVRQRNSNLSQQQSTSDAVNQTSGGVTIVKLNSPTNDSASSKTTGTVIANNTVASSSYLTSPNINYNTRPKQIGGDIITIQTSANITVPTKTETINPNATIGNAIAVTAAPTATVVTTAIVPNISMAPATTGTTTHNGYTKRPKLGDSRSTGRLHSSNNTHRSMTRLHIAGGSVGGLHKSMTRLDSSQQVNQNVAGSNSVNLNGNNSSGNVTHVTNGLSSLTATSTSSSTQYTQQNYVTPVPPLSSNVIITGHNKWGIPATKIQSGGVTVTTSPIRVRPHSQDPSALMGSSGAFGKLSGSAALNQSTGSIGMQYNQSNCISVHHNNQHGHSNITATSPTLGSTNNTFQQPKSVMTLMVNSSSTVPTTSSASGTTNNHEVVISGPMTVTSRRQDNTSVTLINANNSIVNQRMSTFEPYQIMRDTVQQFCEKHFSSIKVYMDNLSRRLPPPTRCGIEERRTKKVAKLHFACQIRGPHCLYSKTCFTMRTRNPKTWIHLMFLDFQIRNYVKDACALSTREPGISNLKNIWNMIKCENKSFTELVTSNFPSVKEQETLVNELRQSGFLDVFEVTKTDRSKPNANELEYQWACFLCNHPEKAVGFFQGTNQPMIEGQLKEKKGKWRLFRRWRTRYFTLSGAHLSCKSGGESIDVNQIRSVKVSRGARNIPKAFEIFTGDQTLILKPKDGKNAEEWVQCLSIVVAHSQARDNPSAKSNSLPARGLSNSRTAF